MNEFLRQARTTLSPVWEQSKRFLAWSNVRYVVVRDKDNATVLRVPLTVVIVVGILALMTKLLPILVIAFIISIFLKYTFDIVQEG